MRLDSQAAFAGMRLMPFDEIGSTNTEALARAKAGDRGPLWIVARQQHVGRGRHGRLWRSEPGNLYATLLLTDAAPSRHLPELAFVAALAVYDAVAEVAPCLHDRLTLKWPNDLLCDGLKLAGILIEGEGAAIAIGVGINCQHHPEDTAYPATDVASCGASVRAEDMFTTLSKTMLRRLSDWNEGVGFAGIRAEWLRRAGSLHGEIRVHINGRYFNGRFDGLDEMGRLRLRCADGRLETISAGDVFPLGVPVAATD